MNGHPVDLSLLQERYFLDNPCETCDFLCQFVVVLGGLTDKLGRAIATEDGTDLHFYAHSTKGSAGNATAMGVAHLAELLEQTADPIDWSWAQDVLGEMRDAVAAVRSFVKTMELELQS